MEAPSTWTSWRLPTSISSESMEDLMLGPTRREVKTDNLPAAPQQVVEAASALGALHTGPKVRATCLAEGPAKTSCLLLMSVKATFSGRSALERRRTPERHNKPKRLLRSYVISSRRWVTPTDSMVLLLRSQKLLCWLWQEKTTLLPPRS